jgi:hypothetical protein
MSLLHSSIIITPMTLQNRSDLIQYLEIEFPFSIGDNAFVEDNDIVYLYTDNLDLIPQVIKAMRNNFSIAKIDIKVY